MPNSAKKLYRAQEVRELDRLAIEEKGIPGIVLMKRAGRVAFNALLSRWPKPEKITVFCGSGNNGGDGYIVAGLASARRIPVDVIQVAPAEKLKGSAKQAWEYAVAEGATMIPRDALTVPSTGIVVDALLGTGLKGEVRAPYDSAIDAINGSGRPVMAVDIPSGLCGDTGASLGTVVKADITPTFIGRKRGLYTGHGPAACGEILFDDLDVDSDIYAVVPAGCDLLDWDKLTPLLKGRPADAHKGLYGHVMIIGGESGFGGAPLMAAEAALRVGAGLVSVATRPEHVPAIISRRPEVMAVGVQSGQELEPKLERPSVLVVGPGLGQTPWSEQLLQKALASGLPLVLDADALNILSQGRVGTGRDIGHAVLTPHPGEAARLLSSSASEIQADRFAAVARLQKASGATVLLKGAGTLIASSEENISLCPYGNGGMAVGGMGDVLSGVIGALLAQGLPPVQAAQIGACLHGLAGDDMAAEYGEVGICASDLMPALRRRRNRT